MKNELTDKYLSELFKNDELDSKPDPTVKARLDYTLMLKDGQSKIRQNSFAGLFTWIFSLKSIPAKAAFVSIILLFSLFNFHQEAGNFTTPTVDSASMLTIPFNIDSVINNPLSSDTCSLPGI